MGEVMRWYEIISESVERATVVAFSQNIKAKYELEKLSLSVHGTNLHLGMMVVPSNDRKSGVGTQVMNDLCAFADRNKLTITLSPASVSDSIGASSSTRLIAFYKRFGFVENKGRNKDYSVSESMYRSPR